MSGHGHVTPNEDGSRARCGGPSICGVCALEAQRKSADTQISALSPKMRERVHRELADEYHAAVVAYRAAQAKRDLAAAAAGAADAALIVAENEVTNAAGALKRIRAEYEASLP